MDGVSLYAKIVPPEELEVRKGVTYIEESDAELYTDLYKIERPAFGNHLDWTEDVILHYHDDTSEKVRGHFVDSGDMEELDNE